MRSDPNDPASLSARFRQRRLRTFAQRAQLCGLANAEVLDVGGTLDYWRTNLRHLPRGLIRSIDVVNLPPTPRTVEMLYGVALYSYEGDALDKQSFRLPRYDVVYSNSVIEHVGNLRLQRLMADAIRGMGRYHFVQTPAKTFPLEPHFYMPFFAYLPLGLRGFLHTRFDLGFMKRNPDWLAARIACEDTRLLTYRELQALFEDSDIVRERFLGLTKSYIATNMRAAAPWARHGRLRASGE